MELWIISSVLLAIVLQVAYTAVYRLYLSPLAKFPGPGLAALTSWYEFFYDIVKDGGGMYIWKVRDMHQKYGPIVRVSPEELHVVDPTFFTEIYAGPSRPRDKYRRYTEGTTAPFSFGFTPDHSLHRLRREPFHSFFSKRRIVELEDVIIGRIEVLCERFRDFSHSGATVNLSLAFVALTTDIISEACFGASFDYLRVSDFAPLWMETVRRRMKTLKLTLHFPWMKQVLKSLPIFVVEKLIGDVSEAGKHKTRIRAQVRAVLDGKADSTHASHSIFRDLIDNPDLPQESKSVDVLTDEGVVLLGAGSETVAKTLGIIFFHLHDQPLILDQLRKELQSKSDAILTWTALEKLPLLTACIEEGLRLHHGLTTRNPRIAPKEDLRYESWTIPAGTPVSTIQALVHLNPEVFPEPAAFKPNRWLNQEGSLDLKSKRFMFSFSRGSRACLGINLAYAELYLTLAALLKYFTFELVDTSVQDVELQRDFNIPTAKLGSLGVQAKIFSM